MDQMKPKATQKKKNNKFWCMMHLIIMYQAKNIKTYIVSTYR